MTKCTHQSSVIKRANIASLLECVFARQKQPSFVPRMKVRCDVPPINREVESLPEWESKSSKYYAKSKRRSPSSFSFSHAKRVKASTAGHGGSRSHIFVKAPTPCSHHVTTFARGSLATDHCPGPAYLSSLSKEKKQPLPLEVLRPRKTQTPPGDSTARPSPLSFPGS